MRMCGITMLQWTLVVIQGAGRPPISHVIVNRSVILSSFNDQYLQNHYTVSSTSSTHLIALFLMKIFCRNSAHGLLSNLFLIILFLPGVGTWNKHSQLGSEKRPAWSNLWWQCMRPSLIQQWQCNITRPAFQLVFNSLLTCREHLFIVTLHVSV